MSSSNYGRFLEPPLLTFDPGSDDEDEEIYADRWSPKSSGLISRALSPLLKSPFRKSSKLLDVDYGNENDYGSVRKSSFWDRLTPDSTGAVFGKSSRRNLPRRY
uniref:Uncharacterized protein n=1 Tax=Panagrolaimus sp. JU765 TaxID=591449 RepID=A0AC34QRU4_9BILA